MVEFPTGPISWVRTRETHSSNEGEGGGRLATIAIPPPLKETFVYDLDKRSMCVGFNGRDSVARGTEEYLTWCVGARLLKLQCV